MTDSSSQYHVTIHGTVYGLAIGDRAKSTMQGGPTTPYPQPFMVPPLPPQGILGRDDVLTQVYDLLLLDDEEATDVAPVALRGLGGIGKTTLVTAIGRLPFMQQQFPDGVLWTAVGPNPTVRILLDDIGRALGVDLLAEHDEIACRDRLRAVLYRRRVLLIVDDVWEITHSQYFTIAGPRCRTILTTRESPVAHAFATRERSVRIDVLRPEASLALLRRLVPEAVQTDEQSAQRLCERLEFLPLALTLAGRLLANEADVPTRMQRLVSELVERRDSRLKLLQDEDRLGLSEDQPVSLQAILGMSVDRLNQVDQQRFAMLSVFGGGPLTWELHAVAHVWDCAFEEAEITMSHFMQRDLVERRGERYWMRALLADYADELMKGMDL